MQVTVGDECVYLMKLLLALLSAWFDGRGAVNLLSFPFVFSFCLFFFLSLYFCTCIECISKTYF